MMETIQYRLETLHRRASRLLIATKFNRRCCGGSARAGAKSSSAARDLQRSTQFDILLLPMLVRTVQNREHSHLVCTLLLYIICSARSSTSNGVAALPSEAVRHGSYETAFEVGSRGAETDPCVISRTTTDNNALGCSRSAKNPSPVRLAEADPQNFPVQGRNELAFLRESDARNATQFDWRTRDTVVGADASITCNSQGKFAAAVTLITEQNLMDDPTRYSSYLLLALAELQAQPWPYMQDHGHGCHDEWHIDGPKAIKHMTLVPGSVKPTIVSNGVYVTGQIDIQARVPTYIRGCDHVLFFCFCSTVCNGWVTFTSRVTASATFVPSLDTTSSIVTITVEQPTVTISDPEYSGCHASWIVSWFIDWKKDVSAALQTGLQQAANKYAKGYGVPQTFKLYNRTYAADCISAFQFSAGVSIIVESQAVMFAEVDDPETRLFVNTTFIPDPADAAMEPPRDWTIPPVVANGQPLLAGLRLSSTVLSGIMWAADVTGAVNVTYNVTIRDADLNFKVFYAAPQTGVPADGQLSLNVNHGLVNVSCGCASVPHDANYCGGGNTGKPMWLRTAMLAVGFGLVTGKGTVTSTSVDGDPAVEMQIISLNTTDTKIQVVAPRLPIAPAVTDAIVRSAIRHLSPVLNAFLRTHPLPLPPNVSPLLPHPSVTLKHQGGCCHNNHGFIELEEKCHCSPTGLNVRRKRLSYFTTAYFGGIAPVWKQCGFSCVEASPSADMSQDSEMHILRNSGVTKFAARRETSDFLPSSDFSELHVAIYSSNGCRLQKSADEMVQTTLRNTHGVCTPVRGTANSSFYAISLIDETGEIDLRFQCFSKSCSSCGVYQKVKVDHCVDISTSSLDTWHLGDEGATGSVMVTSKPCLSFGNVSNSPSPPINSTSLFAEIPVGSQIGGRPDSEVWVFQEFYDPVTSCDVSQLRRGGATVMGSFGTCARSMSSGLWIGVSSPLATKGVEITVQVRFGCNTSTCVSTGCETVFNVTLSECTVLPNNVGAIKLIPQHDLDPCVSTTVPPSPSVFLSIVLQAIVGAFLLVLIIMCLTKRGRRILHANTIRRIMNWIATPISWVETRCAPVTLLCLDVFGAIKSICTVSAALLLVVFRSSRRQIRRLQQTRREYVGFPPEPMARSDWCRVITVCSVSCSVALLGWNWKMNNPFDSFETETLTSFGIPEGDLEPQQFEDTFNRWHNWGAALCWASALLLLAAAGFRACLRQINITPKGLVIVAGSEVVLPMSTAPHVRMWRILAVFAVGLVIPILIMEMFTPAFILDFRTMLTVNATSTQFFIRNPGFVEYLNDLLGVALTSVTLSFLSTEFLFIIQPLPVAVSSLSALFMGMWGVFVRRGKVRWPSSTFERGMKVQSAGVLHTRALLQRAQLYGSIMLLLVPIASILPMIGVYQAFQLPPFWAIAWFLQWLLNFALHVHAWKVMQRLQSYLRKGHDNPSATEPPVSLLVNSAVNIASEVIFVYYLSWSLQGRAVSVNFAVSVLVTSFVAASGLVLLVLMHAAQEVQQDTRVAVRPRRMRDSFHGSVHPPSDDHLSHSTSSIITERKILLNGANEATYVSEQDDSDYLSHDDYFTDEEPYVSNGPSTSSSRFPSVSGSTPVRSSMRSQITTAAATLPPPPEPSVRQRALAQLRSAKDFVLESRERREPHIYGKRPALRRFCLLIGIFPTLYIVWWQWYTRVHTNATEQVNAELRSLPFNVTLPPAADGGSIFSDALSAMWASELVGAFLYTVAAVLLVLSIVVDLFFGSKRGLRLSRFFSFVALPCLFVAAVAPAAPLYVSLLRITRFISCNGAPEFNSMLSTVFGDVDAVFIFALFSAKLMPVLIAVPPMLARGAFLCLESVLHGESLAAERAHSVGGQANALLGETGVASMSMRAVFVTAVVLAPLPTLLPMMALSQGSNDSIVNFLIVAFFIIPLVLAVLMLRTTTMKGAVLSYFSVIGSYMLLVLLIFLRLVLKFHLKDQVLHELSEPILYIEAVAEIGVSAAVVSDVLYVHL